MIQTRISLMREANRVEIRPFFYRRMNLPYLKQYFRQKEVEHLPQIVATETPMIRARRFAQNDVNLNRVYPLMPDLTPEERLELATFAADKVKGPIDSMNFARNALEKFQLTPEGKSQVLKDLDLKTKGFVSESLKSQFGHK